jgi:flagellar hook capping protein FlgD
MLLVLALLGCTAAAFAVTEGLKLEKSPIARTKVGKVVAPDSVKHAKVRIEFVLRKADRLTVQIEDGNGDVIRTLARSKPAPRGTQAFQWNGRDDRGHVVPNGIYRPRVHLAREHRTIVLPNPIRLDATAPLIQLVSVKPRVFSPDGDFQHELIRLQYRANEQSRAIMYLDGNRRTTVFRYVRAGKFDWGGRAARNLPAGTYRIYLRGLDRAGNLSRPSRAVIVRVRYIDLRPHVLHVKSAARFGVRVLTDAKQYSWHLGQRGDVARKRVLVLRAGPAGTYRLVVAANGHVSRAIVLVRP